MIKKKRRSQKLPDEPKPLSLAPTEYQPSKAELEETVDMPGLTRAKVRQAFLRPFQFKRDEPSR